MADWQFVVCNGCSGSGKGFVAELRLACPDVDVVETGCMSVCSDPVTVAAQGAGRASYVFSGIGPGDLGDLKGFAAAYAAAPAGWIEDARPLGRLRFCLLTRIPAVR
jgi:predicted metal-binding protein